MPWARFDDRFPSNRKIRMLGDGAFRLYVSAVCWSAENLTDGFIPHDELLLVSDTRDAEGACEELVRRNLWLPVAGGWQIHDYHEYNPTAEQVRAERKAKTLRQERWRENQRRAKAGLPPLDVDASHDASHDARVDDKCQPQGVVVASNDVAVDASNDASVDASTNASHDASTQSAAGREVVDASTDASRDAAPRARVTRPVPDPPKRTTNPGARADDASPVALFDSAPSARDDEDDQPQPTKLDASSLLGEWLEYRGDHRPSKRIIGQVGKNLKTLLADGIDYDTVREGFMAWENKGLDPAKLDSCVNEVQAARRRQAASSEILPTVPGQRVADVVPFTGSNVVPLTRARPSTTDAAVAQVALAVAAAKARAGYA